MLWTGTKQRQQPGACPTPARRRPRGNMNERRYIPPWYDPSPQGTASDR